MSVTRTDENVGDRVSHHIVVDTFLVHSESAELYILYAISLDLHRRYKHRLAANDEDDDDRFVQVKSLDAHIHYGAFCAIVYTVEFGLGYRLPRIVYNARV